MTFDEALEVLKRSIQTDDNEAWDALDIIEQAKQPRREINWLRLESRISKVLRNTDSGDCSFAEAVVRIDCIMAHELGRGNSLLKAELINNYLPSGKTFDSIESEVWEFAENDT